MVTSAKAKVLVAEDQEHVREALAMLLRGDGYEVGLCSTPQEAVLWVEKQTPEIALLDMNYQRDSTSGIEGLELIQQLRRIDSTLPIIALTGWGNVDLAVNAMKAGANDFIEKPWRNQSLLEKVNALTAQGRRERASQKVSEFERQDASNLQKRIVPPRHVTAGNIEVHGETTPAGAVGGDYFGVWQPTSYSLHLCVADVSGKGTPGALIAAMLYASVSTLSSSGSSPDLILREVENMLAQQLTDGHYITIFYATLDLNTCVLEYVNAGHCPPILQRADGSMEQLMATRTVLGLVFDAEFKRERVALRPGDRLVLYTDGITEANDGSGEEFGVERLVEALAATRELDPDQQRGAVFAQVHRFADGKLGDDATLLVAAVSSHQATGQKHPAPVATISA
jgi:sigma-B regulation protein RsbU (phosphoserine phosphatase)